MTCKEAIYSNEVFDYITDFPVDEGWQTLENAICYERVGDMYHIVHINRDEVPNRDAAFFEYQSIPKLYGLMQEENPELYGLMQGENPELRNEITPGGNLVGSAPPFVGSSLIESGIIQVQQPPLMLTGRGVVICVIDTGIDYRNPVFLDRNGQSRILAIWDQTIEDGTPPQGFLYGAEYSREQINQALNSENPFQVVPSVDENGHGTALCSVAAGSRISADTVQGTTLPAGFVGAAYEAQIVVVKLKEAKQYLRDTYLIPDDVPAFQENDIMQGVAYAERFVRLFERPVVICLGLGTNMGDHDGNGALSSYLNSVAIKRNLSVVVCGGNEGNAAQHFQGNLKTEEGSLIVDGSGQVAMDVELRVDEGNDGFMLQFWGNLPDLYQMSIRSPGGETITPVGLGIRQSVTYGFVYEETRITIESALVEPSSGEELITFRIRRPTPGIWIFRVSASGRIYNGNFHMWLPISAFMYSPVYFLRPSPYVTLTEPAMAQNPIAVSFYNAENNSFAIQSGRGYSRLNRIRPDLAAPGVGVETVRGPRTGSSFAAAITAGAVAQFFQWAVVERNQLFAESKEIKSFFLRGASRNPELSYPNREWGYGRLNLQGVFDRLIIN